jgi:hypothetical protein
MRMQGIMSPAPHSILLPHFGHRRTTIGASKRQVVAADMVQPPGRKGYLDVPDCGALSAKGNALCVGDDGHIRSLTRNRPPDREHHHHLFVTAFGPAVFGIAGDVLRPADFRPATGSAAEHSDDGSRIGVRDVVGNWFD